MSMTLHDFKGAHEPICPARQKLDLETLKSQIFNKLDSINQEHQKSKTNGSMVIKKKSKS